MLAAGCAGDSRRRPALSRLRGR
ncbi:hypothetical protein K7C98_08870 [Nannocystis pusilla]|uniref:Lipoprotein n=1 Tax=Nannocystis pusilla TaxID=889268 RepID=A0ABS7TME6_9BACT|nr:hypothetical protein [Nannocystis pusilla]